MTGPPLDRRIDVLGVAISAIDLDGAVATIERWILEGERHYVCVTGVHGVMESQRDPELAHVHNRSGMTTPDGMPMVWCGRHLGVASMDRVYGPELFEAVAEVGAGRGWRFFYYGGAEGVADELARTMAERHPGIVTAGTHCPPFRALSPDEEDHIVDLIEEARADVVWVGLSTPKQERWMARMRPRLSAPVLVGVGAAFDFHTGRVRQSPRWIQRSGFEWLFRVAMEPRRLWRRYAINNTGFLLRIARRPPTLVDHPPRRT